MATPATTEGTFQCPDCDRKFQSPQGLGRHRKDTHGAAPVRDKRSSAEKNAARARRAELERVQRLTVSSVRSSLQEIVEPLKEQLREIETRLSEIEIEEVTLKEARKDITSVLQKLDPTSFVAKPKKTSSLNNSTEMTEAKKQAVLSFIQTHEYPDGLTAAGVWRDMRAAGVEPITTPAKIKVMVEEFHANGVLRADRKIRGGAMLYMIVGNGASDGAA